jgi:hypothetical protein
VVVSGKKEQPTLFSEIAPDQREFAFQIPSSFDKDFNIYTYRNFYNGGGVAIADINNDGAVRCIPNGKNGAKPVVP